MAVSAAGAEEVLATRTSDTPADWPRLEAQWTDSIERASPTLPAWDLDPPEAPRARDMSLPLLADDLGPWFEKHEVITPRKHFYTWDQRYQTISNASILLREHIEEVLGSRRTPTYLYIPIEILSLAFHDSLALGIHELGHAAGTVPMLRGGTNRVTAALVPEKQQHLGVPYENTSQLHFLGAALRGEIGYSTDLQASNRCSSADRECWRKITRMFAMGLASGQLLAENRYLDALYRQRFHAYDFSAYLAPRLHDLGYQQLALHANAEEMWGRPVWLDPIAFRYLLGTQGYAAPRQETMRAASFLSLALSGGTLQYAASLWRYRTRGEKASAPSLSWAFGDDARVYWPEVSVFMNEDNYAWRTLVPMRFGRTLVTAGLEIPMYGNQKKYEASLRVRSVWWHRMGLELSGDTHGAVNALGGLYVGQALRLEHEASGFFLSGAASVTFGRSNEGMRQMPAASAGDSAFSLSAGYVWRGGR